MRLIDSDLLQKVLAKEPMENRTYLRANEIVVDMPTAYDIDKVVERIKELDVKSIPKYKGGTFGDYKGTDYYIKKSDVLNIIESGLQ